jgi:VWFA-related protein
MRAAVAAAALAMVQSAAASPPLHSPAPQPVEVRIDVVAADARGRIIDNLKAADFEVRDDGVAQPADAVRVVRADAKEGRLIALFLDEYHVSASLTDRVREALAHFIADAIDARDQIVVLKPLDSLLAIQPTRDRDALRDAVAAFEGRKGEYEPRNAYERNFMAGAPARIESARTQVALSAINALAVHFGNYPDRRKTLLVISEGVGRSGERRRGMEYLPTAETIARSAQRANVSIYAVNPAVEFTDADTLRDLAAGTAGGVVTADLDDGLRRAMADASGYYMVAYRTSRPDDGRFHPVVVQLKRPVAQLRARSGYFAPSPDETLRDVLLARLNEPKRPVPVEPAPHASTLIRPWIGTSRGVDGKTRVTVVWEPVPKLTGERNRRAPTRATLTALAPDATVLFEGVVNPSAPALLDEPGGTAARAVFEMMPGRVRLRMSIQDSAQQVLDTDVRSVTIRDLRRGVTISTPEILRARNAREFRTLDSPLAVPSASREFSRTERLLIRFSASGASNAPVSVSARLLSRMGPMRDLTIVAGQSGASTIDLPLAGLAVGEYLIEVSASGPDGEAKDLIDFRVTT